jgi:5-formyltetrahydrofolate cyclo-ligase
VDHLTAQPEQDPRTIEHAKQQVRDRIWALLEREGVAKPPGRVVGKIPNFLGAEAAADWLAALPAWAAARVVKANPDKAQRAVRARALTEGKVLYMAVPRLAEELPFYLLDPQHPSTWACPHGKRLPRKAPPPRDGRSRPGNCHRWT